MIERNRPRQLDKANAEAVKISEKDVNERKQKSSKTTNGLYNFSLRYRGAKPKTKTKQTYV